jgi:hypothetical protein
MPEYLVLALVAAIRRDHLAAIAGSAKYADDAVLGRVEAAHRLGLGLAGFTADQAGQYAGAFRQFFAGRALGQPEQRRLLRPRPGQRPHQREAVGVAARALDRHSFRKEAPAQSSAGRRRAPPPEREARNIARKAG